LNVLVVNCGSSSIKYQVFDMTDSRVVTSGLLERIGESESNLGHRWINEEGTYEEIDQSRRITNHREGFDWIVAVNSETGSVKEGNELYGIGHRVVHGGEAFHEPGLINEKVVGTIREMNPLAPLHNPANLIGIEVALERRRDVPQVAVFDTAFHQTMPAHAFRYAIPDELYSAHHVRRYGFHGTSHHYVSKEAARHLGKPLESLNLITLHLGNGASAAAIESGKSIDTSMGMTPLEGLIMGTRCGDIDPALHFYLKGETGKSDGELESMLNKESGLKGICGKNDMREILRLAGEGDEAARLAIDMYCYRIRKYIGAYAAALGRVDALVFTGGIGENAALIRKRSCEGLALLGIKLDNQKNESVSGAIAELQEGQDGVKVLVIPTNEELEIARQTVECIKKRMTNKD
jgi:acetate kinase